MTVLGQVLLIVACATSLGSAFLYGRASVTGRSVGGFPRWLLTFSTLCVTGVSALLLTLILQHDFRIAYVFGYSDRSLPLHFLLSSFYAGQAGSFLFWCLMSALIALWLASYTRARGSEAWVMTVFMAVQTALLLLVLTKSPFQAVWEEYPDVFTPGEMPADGRGLNPLLQNFWMVIHPPVLFVGFAAMAVPFAMAVGGLWRKRYDLLTTQGLPWLLIGTGILGLGIMLGAYWAYGVLGWGGYWGWDPVENSSLVPWITGVALVHTLLAQRRTGKFPRTNYALAIITYVLVIYSTFLTRSGVLGDASVHAFTDPGAMVYWVLLGFLVVLAGSGFTLLALRWRELGPASGAPAWLTRETVLGGGALVLLLSAAVILFGTSLPIFSTLRVEPSFYDATNLPLAILMGLFIGLSLYTQWEENDGAGILRRSRPAAAASLLVTAVLFIMGMRDPGTTALAFVAFFALFVNVDVGARILAGDPLFLGGKITHIGLALFFLGVIGTGKYTDTDQVALPRGQAVPAVGYMLTYQGYEPLPDGKYAFHVDVQDENQTLFRLSPVMFEAREQGLMRNPDIASFLLKDVYLSPISLQESPRGAEETRHTLEKGKELTIGGTVVRFLRFDMANHASQQPAGAMTVAAVLEVRREGETESLVPSLTYAGGGPRSSEPVASRLLAAGVRLVSMQAGMGDRPSSITFAVVGREHSHAEDETLIADISTKPFINLLWVGTVMMVLGFALSTVKRLKGSP